MPLVADIRGRMDTIRRNTRSADIRGVMDIAIRALGTLENYLLRLEQQIEARYPVAENELLLEEIRVCIAGIDDLLQDFSSRQVAEVALLNDEMYRQSYQGFIVNILLILATVAASAFAIQYIIRGSVEEQKQRQKLEYRVLQEQITPHFLYNTLDAIIWAAEGGDDAAVITLVTALSSFFRTAVSHGVDFVPVSSEIEHVKSYLAIQQMRYSDILSYEIIADEELKEQIILKLLLQPLVENSLYHGIRGTRDRGKIAVVIKKDGNKMRFTVADDGIGMSAERLAELREDLKSGSGEKGYGLFNVNRRLKLYYGLKEDIDIQSEYGKGTAVSFALDMA
jgi:two-component system sensor histidine kinase YesM